MLLRSARRVAAGVLLVAIASCSQKSPTVLRTGARFPDAEGVATQVTLERIQLDGKRDYKITENVESFTTRSHETTPLLTWAGKFVQLGLSDKNEVLWVAGVGTVVKANPPYTLYTGSFERVERGRAVFRDGTTLALGRGVVPPRKGESLVTIDPTKHVITKIAPD